MTKEILLVAGEASGDLHAGVVARELRERAPQFHLAGIGGDHMAAAGVELVEHAGKLAVMGFLEVLQHVPRHWALLRQLRRRLEGGQVALLIVVDYPGFNMKLAKAAHDAGVPVLYFITPQVWAWGSGRLTEMARIITRAAVILPFEEALLRRHGVPAVFVGHPLLDRAASLPDRAAARAKLGLAADRPVLALFPGSRPQEIARHLDPFVATARLLEQRHPGLQVVVSGAPTVSIDLARCPYPVVPGDSYAVLRAADAAMCKSGTTTLEAAVAGCPLVVAYRTSSLTYAAARRLVKIPHIGLVNVVAGREVAPEFVQDALVPERAADALDRLIVPGDARDRMLADLGAVRASLGERGAAARVADMAIGLATGDGRG